MRMRQHYHPRFLLKGFLGQDGKVIGMRKTGEIFPVDIKKIGAENNFFTFDEARDAGEYYGIHIDQNCLEMELANKHEPLVRTILDSIKNNQNFDSLNKEDIEFLLQWVAWLHIANPATKSFLKGRNPFLYSNTTLCGAYINWHAKIQNVFLAKSWGLRFCDEPFLITSDRPVSLDTKLESPKDTIGLNKATILLPLSPQLALVGIPNAQQGLLIKKPMKLTQPEELLARKMILSGAEKFFIADSRSTLDRFLGFPII